MDVALKHKEGQYGKVRNKVFMQNYTENLNLNGKASKT